MEGTPSCQACKMRASKQTRSILSGETWRSSDPMLHAGISHSVGKKGCPEATQSSLVNCFHSDRKENSMSLHSSSCPETHESEATLSYRLSRGHVSPTFCPTNKLNWGELMCHPVCVILRRIIITIWSSIKGTMCLCANPPPRPAPSPASLSVSPVTGSMSPSSASQILARKKRRGVSSLWAKGGRGGGVIYKL